MGDAAHGEALSALALELVLEESLLLALPTTLAKPTDQRHGFDDLVLQELEQVLRARIGKVDASNKAEAVKVAQLVVEQAVATEGRKDDELIVARIEYEQQRGIYGAVIDANVAFESEYTQGVAALEKLTAKLDAFTYPWECYALLKERVAKTQEAEPSVGESTANVLGVECDGVSQVAPAMECIADPETVDITEANPKVQLDV